MTHSGRFGLFAPYVGQGADEGQAAGRALALAVLLLVEMFVPAEQRLAHLLAARFAQLLGVDQVLDDQVWERKTKIHPELVAIFRSMPICEKKTVSA